MNKYDVTQKAKLDNLDIIYKVIRTKVDEVESTYIEEEDVTVPNYELESKVIGTNIKGIRSLVLEYIQTRDIPTTVYVKDRYLKIRPEKTLYLDKNLTPPIDNSFEDFAEEDIIIPELLFEKGTFVRLPYNVVKTQADFTYYFVTGYNEVCQIPNFKTTQVMLIEQNQVCPQVYTIDEEQLAKLKITGNCKDKAKNYIERFGRDTQCVPPFAEDIAIEKIEEISETIEKLGGSISNIGNNFAQGLAEELEKNPLRVKIVDCVNVCQSSGRHFPYYYSNPAIRSTPGPSATTSTSDANVEDIVFTNKVEEPNKFTSNYPKSDYTLPDAPVVFNPIKPPLSNLIAEIRSSELPLPDPGQKFGNFVEGSGFVKADQPTLTPDNLGQGADSETVVTGVDIFGNEVVKGVRGNKLGCCS